MKFHRIAGIVFVIVSTVGVYCKVHMRQNNSQYAEMQSSFAATSDTGRPSPRLASYSADQDGQPGEDVQAPERPLRAGTDPYDSANSGSTAAGPATGGPATLNPASWMRQTAGDRSAAVSLPPNWRLTSVASGAAGVDGPNKEQVVLGFQTFVTPGSRSYAPYMEPEQALKWFTRTQGIQLVRVLERAPAGQGNAGRQAEFITVETQQQDGTRYKALALVMTDPMQMNIWKFYISYIAAPEEQFDAEAPTMAAIWKSWKLDGGYVQGSFNHAAQIQAQTRSMMMQHAQHSMHAFDNVNEAIDETIRGVSTMENTDTGVRRETQIGTEQQVIRNCQRQGINCREVPTNELVQPQ